MCPVTTSWSTGDARHGEACSSGGGQLRAGAARMQRAVKVLFVCYGAGHVEMCLPVLRALRNAQPACETVLLALTTAFAVARNAGESPLGYRDFVDGPDGDRALVYGHELLAGHPQHPQVAPEESAAYLGFNFLDWVDAHGEVSAWQRWHASGRQGFLPVQFFAKLLRRIQPDVVVTTNSPRSEQAAIEAAAGLGIPSLSMVDLFALPGDSYLQRRVHATRITVFVEATRVNLMASGVDPARIVVTGNPAMDGLGGLALRRLGRRWLQAKGWEGRHVILWAGDKEPCDVFPPEWAGLGLAQAVQERLVNWAFTRDDVCLAVRYHPNEWHEFSPPALHPRIHWSRPDREPLQPVLMAAGQVVVQGTTVGAQAFVAKKRVVSLRFSPSVIRSGVDYSELGMAAGANSLDEMVSLLEQGVRTVGLYPPVGGSPPSAAAQVAGLVAELAQQGISQ